MAKGKTPEKKSGKSLRPLPVGFGGSQPNAGRKSKASMLGLIALLDKCWAAPEREACITRLGILANEGNMDAIKLLMAYAFGKPKETKEISGLDGGAIAITVSYVNRPIS